MPPTRPDPVPLRRDELPKGDSLLDLIPPGVDPITTGDVLRGYRKAVAGLSLSQASLLANLAKSHISKMENGKLGIALGVSDELARAYGVDPVEVALQLVKVALPDGFVRDRSSAKLFESIVRSVRAERKARAPV